MRLSTPAETIAACAAILALLEQQQARRRADGKTW